MYKGLHSKKRNKSTGNTQRQCNVHEKLEMHVGWVGKEVEIVNKIQNMKPLIHVLLGFRP